MTSPPPTQPVDWEQARHSWAAELAAYNKHLRESGRAVIVFSPSTVSASQLEEL